MFKIYKKLRRYF